MVNMESELNELGLYGESTVVEWLMRIKTTGKNMDEGGDS